jgi:hypothetical protein
LFASAGVVFGLVFGLFLGPFDGLVLGRAFGLIFGLSNGGNAVIRHFTLRFLLSIGGLAPLNYPAFLNYAADLLFFYKVGGAYRFRHAILQEYFASLDCIEGLGGSDTKT